ncbi:MAG: putative DNA binding domain-containing protein, partial [Prevotellaceae bacterium]|nr:putative DNA binding domain-containing protein [Candidatus Faecinaster equi]
MTTSSFPPESQTIEYKESWRDEYLKWICGFANAQGGTLYLGINDQRQVVGITHSKQLLEQIPNMITMTMGIMADIDLHYEEEKEYISIHVAQQPMPIAYKGKYYYRTGSTLQELTGIALQDFMMKKMNLTWDSQIVEEATLDDIDPEAISYFVRQGILSKRLPQTAKESSIESILTNLNMIRDGKLTMAALLLFGKNPQYYVTSARFRIGRFGSSDAMLISQDIIEGNLMQMADKVMIALDKYLIRPIHYEGMQRIEPLEIPEAGLREIIYNAIVHKDYRGADIQMKIYSDHIHLWNEGVLPDNITIDDLFRQHDSVPRNRLIASAFYYAGFIESWGRGFPTIKEAFEAEKLSVPKFIIEQGGLAAIIQREKYLASTTNVGVNVGV